MAEPQFNLNLLRTLDALLETRNVTAAAERLGLTQSAVSRQLATLRKSLGDPLLVRDGQRNVTTTHAENLRRRLADLLFDAESLLTPPAFDPQICTREFTICGSDYLAEHILPLLTQSLAQMAPRLRICFRQWQPGSYRLLAEGDADLVATIADSIPDNLHGRTMGSDRAVCVMRNAHPLAQAPLTLKDYLAWPHICISGGGEKDARLEQALAMQGVHRHIQITVPYVASALQVLGSGDFLLTLPEHMALALARNWPIAWKPLPFEAPQYTYWLFWHGRQHHDSAHQWLRTQWFDSLANADYGITSFNARKLNHSTDA